MFNESSIIPINEKDLGQTAGFLWNLYKEDILHKEELSIDGEKVKYLKLSHGEYQGIHINKIPSQSDFCFKWIDIGEILIEKKKQGHTIKTILYFDENKGELDF